MNECSHRLKYWTPALSRELLFLFFIALSNTHDFYFIIIIGVSISVGIIIRSSIFYFLIISSIFFILWFNPDANLSGALNNEKSFRSFKII